MGKKSPQYSPPAPVQRISGEELFGQGTNWAKTSAPNAFGAREQALLDVNDPNYYAKFQPTSFEQALGNQYFQNIFPNQEAILRNQYSRTGMADSPVLGDALTRAYGKTAYDVGSYLSNLGNERAIQSLNYRNIDPMSSLIMPYVQTSANQSNMNASAQDQYNQAMAQVEYQNAMNKYNQNMALTKTLGSISPLGGLIYGGATGGGAGIGQSLSGTVDTAKAFIPMMSGTGGMFSNIGKSSSVNPNVSNGVNFVDNNMDLGRYLMPVNAGNNYPIIWN